MWQTLISRRITRDLLRGNRQLCLYDVGAVLQGKPDLFRNRDIGDGYKRRRIGRPQTNTPRPQAFRDVQRLLQDILRFTHRPFRYNNITLALLHLGF